MNLDTEGCDVLLLELSGQVTLDESGLFVAPQSVESFAKGKKRSGGAQVDGRGQMEMDLLG